MSNINLPRHRRGLRQANRTKLKRTKAALAVRRALDDESYNRQVGLRIGGNPPKYPYPKLPTERSLWQRFKDWLIPIFGRKKVHDDYHGDF